MRRLDQLLEIGVGAEMRVDLREVGHPIAVIASAFVAWPALNGLVPENRRQPDGGRAQSLNIVEPGGQAFKVPAMIESARCRIIAGLERAAAQPALVIAPIAIGEDGLSYNVNADTAASKIAEFLNASKLILLTNVRGILDSNGETIKEIDKKEASRLIASKVINEGMIPKVRGALEAIEAGVGSVQIIDGSEQHALLLEWTPL